MRKHTIPHRRRTMGLRWGSTRRPAPPSRNDHIHLFSTENNARRIREALRELDQGRGHRMTLEAFGERFGGGEI